MPKRIQVPIGTVFGRLKTTSEVFTIRSKTSKASYGGVMAICECGKEAQYFLSNLKKGVSKSCGCLAKDLAISRYSTHGMTNKHPLWTVWQNMKSRCYYEKNNRYGRYGARGITVCDEWRNDFIVFYDWCMSNGWRHGLEIDRINNDGNYEPSNCRIVTRAENCRNRSTAKFVTHQILTIRNLFRMAAFTQSELAKIYDTDDTTISRILKNQSWVF